MAVKSTIEYRRLSTVDNLNNFWYKSEYRYRYTYCFYLSFIYLCITPLTDSEEPNQSRVWIFIKNHTFTPKKAAKKIQKRKSCSELFLTKHSLILQSFVFFKPLFRDHWEHFFSNTTHFTLIQLHKVTPGSCSIQSQRSSAGAGGVKCFCQGHHQRGLLEKRESVTQTLPPAQRWGGALQSQANIFTLRSLKLKSQRNFTDLFQNSFQD